MTEILTELRRRNIFRVAGVYAVVGWILMQVAGALENAMNLPPWFDTLVVSLLLLGFPIAMLLAWAFEMTPEGVKRTETVDEGESVTAKTGRTLDYVIIGGLVLVAALVIWQGTRPAPAPFEAAKDAAPQDEVIDNGNANPHPEERGPNLLGGASKDASIGTTPSIAVLPFEDFSSDKDQEYFANGISEELLNVLARIDGLKVSSRTSAFAFKNRKASTGEIAKALNVGHILEGSIRKAGATLRITAQLIDTKTDEHMWSQTYDRPLTAENIFAIQDEIAAAIVGELKGKLSLAPAKQAPRTENLEAYELYLRARQNLNKRKPGPLKAAKTGFQQVITLDPEFAPAYSGLADTYLLMDNYTDMQTIESIRLAKPHVERALALAPNSAESLASAALLAINENEYEKAVAFADRAIAANPNYADAYLRKVNATVNRANNHEVLATIQKALALDPLSPVILNNVSYAQLQVGDREAARKTMRDNVRWNPDSPFGFQNLARLSYEDGDIAGAHSLYMDALALNPENDTSQGALANVYFALGMYSEVSKVSKQPDDLALALFLRGQKESAQHLAREHPDNPGMSYVLFASGDLKGAYPGFRKYVTDTKLVESKVIPYTAIRYGFLAYIFKENGDADAELFVDQLESYFGRDKATDYNLGDDLRTGILLQLTKGDKKAAYVWIDRFLNLGFASEAFFTTPPFDDLRGTTEYAKREVRMKQNAAKHRTAIEAQLANPKPNWVEIKSQK